MSSIIKSQAVQMGSTYQLLPKEDPSLLDLKTVLEQENHPDRIQAMRVLERAQAEAEEIVAEARAEAERIRADMEEMMHGQCQSAFEDAFEKGSTQGYTEGYDSGYQKGYEEGFAQNRAAAEALRQALEQYEAIWRQNMEDNLDDLKYLALDIAGKIIGKTLESDAEIYLRLIEKGLSTFRGYSWVDIYLSADTAPEATLCLEEKLAERLQIDANYIKIRRKADLKPGDCMIETESGVVDVGIQTQYAQVEAALQDEDAYGE